MEFRILGSTDVLLEDHRLLQLPTGRGRSLLALLMLHCGEPVAAERIIDELWGEDPPRTAGTVVQGLVSRLRRSLEPSRSQSGPSPLLQTVGKGYRLAVDPDAIDANRFRRLLDEARGAPPQERSSKLADALGMWRGPALADFTYEPFAQRAITALEELRIQAIEDRFEAEVSLGRAAGSIAELQETIAGHPLRERLRGFLMLALYQAGRQSEALDVYRATRSLLAAELGLEPAPELKRLQTAMLRQDPALILRPVSRPAHSPAETTSPWLPRERRTITVVVMDLAPEADRSVDPEATTRAGAQAAGTAFGVLERHGGRAELQFGDTLVALFGFPVAHEDDPVRAARAALDARTAVFALNGERSRSARIHNRCRAGIETGEIIVGGAGGSVHEVVSGPVVTQARRLQEAADDGDLIVGASTARSLSGRAILKAVKPFAMNASPAWRVLEVLRDDSSFPREPDAPMVGRQHELTRLRSAFRRAIRSRAVVRTIVLGEAGIGKTRLARELAASIGEDADVITLRCPPYEEATFAPLRMAVVEAAGLRGWRPLYELLARDAQGGRALAEIADAIQLPATPLTSGALFAAMRRLFEVLSNERPLIVIFDDLHWAGTPLLELVDDLAQDGAGRILLVCLARPELIERRPGWERNDRLELAPLSSGELMDLLTYRAVSPLSPDASRRIADTSQGNPLFAEQLLAFLDQDAADAVPASLQSLLTMRLDRLGPGERDVLRCASIVAMEVERDAVCALLPEDADPFVGRHLDALERKRLIQRIGEDRFRFDHVLIRMAAYQSMTRADRARLHERFAVWLEGRSADAPRELSRVLGYHLEQADTHRRAGGAIL